MKDNTEQTVQRVKKENVADVEYIIIQTPGMNGSVKIEGRLTGKELQKAVAPNDTA